MAEKNVKAVKKSKAIETPVQAKRAETVYPIRGNIFEGKVVSAKANKTVTVEILRINKLLEEY